MRDLRNPSFLVSDFAPEATMTGAQDVKLLIANLRELNRYHELLELIELHQEFSQTFKDRGIPFSERKYDDDLAQLEKRAYHLIAY